MSLQDKIQKQLSDAGKKVPQIVINDDSGSVDLPANVSATFRNCTISSLTTGGNNRVNIEGGTVQSMTLKGTALIARSCTISGAISADASSKLELDAVTCSGPITLTASALSSRKSTYSGSSIFTMSGKSLVRSVLDTFSGSTLLTASDASTAAAFYNPTISGISTLLALSSGAKCEIDGGTLQCTDMGTMDGASSLEVRNCTSFQATSLVTATGGSRVIFRKMDLVQSSTGFNLTDSTIEVLDVKTLQTDETMFTLDNSRLEVVRFTELQGKTYFQATNNSVGRVANGTTMRPSELVGELTDSKFLFDKITTMISEQALMTLTKSTATFTDITNIIGKKDAGFTLDNSTLLMTGCEVVGSQVGKLVNMSNISTLIMKDCKNIQANSGLLILGTDQGEVHISGSDFVFGRDGVIETSGVFTVTMTGNTTISAQGTVIRMSSNGGSTLNLSSNNSMNTNQDSVIYVTGVDCFLTALPDISNNGSRFTIRGDNGGTERQRIKLSRVIITAGGFDMSYYDVDMFAVTFKKCNFQHSSIEMVRVEQQEDQNRDDCRFDNSVVRDRFGIWQANIYSNVSLLEFQKSTTHNKFKPVDSVLRLDVINVAGGGGVESDNGVSRGNVVQASGYDVGDITSSDTRKDSFLLFNVGSPTYSGRGSLLVMESGEPDEGSMDYIMIKDDDIRIFDFRNVYEDFTSNINRSTPNNIQDDADNNITVTAQLTLDLKGVQEANLESPSTVNIQAPTINEQS